jgi:hypothetical protein|tara:strand:+ start:4808 stop:4975 length:168 start_codon:yes stop_codon:yes gene_type:complete
MKIYIAGDGHDMGTDFMRREEIKRFLLCYHNIFRKRFGLIRKLNKSLEAGEKNVK